MMRKLRVTWTSEEDSLVSTDTLMNLQTVSCCCNCHFIIGSAVVLHCCKAHARINRKTKNLTACKIVTPKNFSSKLCTHDYVGDGNNPVNLCANRLDGGFSPTRWNITHLWLLTRTITRTCRTDGLIFMLYGSDDVFLYKKLPFGVGRSVTSFRENMPQKFPKSGRE